MRTCRRRLCSLDQVEVLRLTTQRQSSMLGGHERRLFPGQPMRHHGAHGDLRPNLRLGRSKMAGVLRSSDRKNEERREGFFEEGGFFEEWGYFEEGRFFEESPSFFVLQSRRSKTPFFDLRSRRSKNPPSSIFDLRSRRSKNPPSSIFDLRSRRSKNPPSSIFGAEEWVEDRTEEGGGAGLLPPKNEEPPFSTFSARRTKNPHLPSSRPEEWTKNLPGTSSSDPSLGHQLPSAILRSGSSDRSSTLIGPKIEIGPLFRCIDVPFCSVPSRCLAVHRPESTRQWYVRVLDAIIFAAPGLEVPLSLTLGHLFANISCRSSASPARGFCVDLRSSFESRAATP